MVPQYNVTILLSANVTSRLLAAEQFTEALLLIDEPGSAVSPTRPILNCGNAGAPDQRVAWTGSLRYPEYRRHKHDL